MPKKGGNKKKKKLRKQISDPTGSKIQKSQQKQPPPEFERSPLRPPVRAPVRAPEPALSGRPVFGTLTSAKTVFGAGDNFLLSAPSAKKVITARETARRQQDIEDEERAIYLRDRGLVEKMVDGKLKTVKFKNIAPVFNLKKLPKKIFPIPPSPPVNLLNPKKSTNMFGGIDFNKEFDKRVMKGPNANITRPIVRGPKPIVRSHTGIIRDTTSNSTAPSVLPRNFKVIESQLKPDGMDDAKRAMSGRGSLVDEVNHHKFGDSFNIGDAIGKEASDRMEGFVSEDPTLQGAVTTDEDDVFGSAEEGSPVDSFKRALTDREKDALQMRLAQEENSGGPNQPPARGAFETRPEVLEERKKQEDIRKKFKEKQQQKRDKQLKKQQDLLSQPDLQPEEDLGFMKQTRKPRADKGLKRGKRGRGRGGTGKGRGTT